MGEAVTSLLGRSSVASAGRVADRDSPTLAPARQNCCRRPRPGRSAVVRRGDLARTPRQQPRRHHERLLRSGVAVEAAEEALCREGPDSCRVLGDDGDGRLEQLGEQQVVEPDQGDLVLTSERVQRPDRPQGDEVLGGEQCGGRLGQGQQLADRVSASASERRPSTCSGRRPGPAAAIASWKPADRSRAVEIRSSSARWAIRRCPAASRCAVAVAAAWWLSLTTASASRPTGGRSTKTRGVPCSRSACR